MAAAEDLLPELRRFSSFDEVDEWDIDFSRGTGIGFSLKGRLLTIDVAEKTKQNINEKFYSTAIFLATQKKSVYSNWYITI